MRGFKQTHKLPISTKVLMFFGAIICFLLGSGAIILAVLSSQSYQGPKTKNFDGKKFLNREPIKHPKFWEGFKYHLTSRSQPWRDWTENHRYPPPPDCVGRGQLQVTFINHASVLIQIDGLNLLTDPIWSKRCSPLAWIGPQRKRSPGLALNDLPPIDYILISHNHYDHLDLPTLRQLCIRPNVKIITGLGNRAFLKKHGISNVIEMNWDQKIDLNTEVVIHGLTARHFSARGLFDRNATLWMSFLIQGPAGAVYFTGDTGFGPHFAEVGQKFGPIRLALLPIGCYLPEWFMKDIHLSPKEAVLAHKHLHAATSVGIHFGTFNLSAEGQNQPVEELKYALNNEVGPRPRFWVLGFGESREIPPISGKLQ